MPFEQALERNIFSSQQEKTFIDKLLAREDVDALRQLIKKPSLKRSELLEILYLISGVEAKLLNYSEWDRYVILKFFVWIREFVKVGEMFYDYTDDRQTRIEGGLVGDPVTEQLIKNNRRMIEHNIKFLLDLYLNIGRTSLSLGATGFLEILKNKYEISYPDAPATAQAAAATQGSGIFTRGKK